MILTEFSYTHKKNNTTICLKAEAIINGAVNKTKYHFNYNHPNQKAIINLMTDCGDLIENKTPLRATIGLDDYNRLHRLDLYKVDDDAYPVITIVGIGEF